jgi:trk system potassium uptake protein TrkH
MALASLPVCVLFDERHALAAFGWTGFASLFLGQLLVQSCRRVSELELRDAMFVAALGWLIVPLLGALPLLLVAQRAAELPGTPASVAVFTEPWNAIFEGFSGFTSTGLTMSPRPSELPHVLQWWRSFMQWIGGVGVIVLLLSVVRPIVSAHRLYQSEARTERIAPSVTSTVRTIWWIYLLYTAAGVGLLHLSGAPLWEAVNHSFTAIATGGFTITDGSAQGIARASRLVLLLLFVMGAVSFTTHHTMLRQRRPSALWSGAEQRALFGLLALGSVLLVAENAWSEVGASWIDGVFQWCSALSTAGFQTADLAAWGPTAKLLLAAGMVAGGAAGSTAGGIKLIRVVYLYKGLRWRIREVTRSPREVMRYEVDGRGLPEAEAEHAVEAAGVLGTLWLAVLVVSVVLLVHVVQPEFSLSDAILEAASAQGNVGLSTGITQPALPWSGKLVLMASMWIGRLEILPVMILLVAPMGGRRNRLRRFVRRRLARNA